MVFVVTGDVDRRLLSDGEQNGRRALERRIQIPGWCSFERLSGFQSPVFSDQGLQSSVKRQACPCLFPSSTCPTLHSHLSEFSDRRLQDKHLPNNLILKSAEPAHSACWFQWKLWVLSTSRTDVTWSTQIWKSWLIFSVMKPTEGTELVEYSELPREYFQYSILLLPVPSP